MDLLSLILLHLPHHPPTFLQLCLPSQAQWTQDLGCGWSQNKKGVVVVQELAETAVAPHWVQSGGIYTSLTPPRTSPLCLFPPLGSWLQVSETSTNDIIIKTKLFLCLCHLNNMVEEEIPLFVSILYLLSKKVYFKTPLYFCYYL